MSIQKGVKAHGEKGKESSVKGIKNITIKNPYFGGISCKTITSDMKHKALPLLIFVVSKRSGEFKTCRVSNGIFQRLCTEKSESSSPAPDHYSFKHVFDMIEKEKRDIATVYLSGFFIHKDRKYEDLLMLKSLVRTNGGSFWLKRIGSMRDVLCAIEGCMTR